MRCGTHPKAEVVAKCAGCRKPLCAECAVTVAGKAWCGECLARAVAPPPRGRRDWRHSRLVAGLLSILPGVGHMYLGLIGKGFALFGLLAASVFLVILYSDSTGMYWMTAYLIPTLSVLFLSYAVFDSIAIAEALKAGKEPPEAIDAPMKAIWERVLLNRRTLGWVILVAGGIGVLHLFEEPLSALTKRALSVDFRVTALVIPLLLLAIGAWLLVKGRRER